MMKVGSKNTFINQKAIHKQKQEDPYEKVARSMEENFLRFLVEKMRETAPSAEDKSTAMNYYKNILNQERAKVMAEANGGTGIKEMILKQIAPHRYKAQQAVFKGKIHE